MQEILQRLEMIKNAIMLEDEDIIELQVMKLSKLTLDADATHILNLLENNSYETVINLIESYRQSKMGLASYEDTEVYGLRLELKMLEVKYEDLNLEKVSLESLLDDYNRQYYHKCGELIEAILLCRTKLQEQRATENPEDEEQATAFEEAQTDYEEFHKDYSKIAEDLPVELSEDDEKELKSAYRRASRLCHPDKVSDELKGQAAEVFKQLSEAYKNKNLKVVEEILASLEGRKGFSIFSDTVTDADKLRKRIDEIQVKIASVKAEIKMIKEDDAYKIIEAVNSWNDYFSDMRVSLRTELERLRSVSDEAIRG